MIPDGAVEAAAKGLSVDVYDSWQDVPEHVRYSYRLSARLAIEAAAPHLMAPVLALADKWQADFPDKARQLREAIGEVQ